MATTRKPKALLEAEKRIASLEAELKQQKTYSEVFSKRAAEAQETLNGLHEILDDLGIRGYRDENKYTRIPLTVRLFAWALNNRREG